MIVKANSSKLIMSPSFDRNTKEYTVKTGKNTDSVMVDTSLYSGYKATVDGKTVSETLQRYRWGIRTAK